MPPHTWNSWQRSPRGQHGVVEHHDSMTTAQQAFRAGSCTTERHSRSTPKPPRRDAGSGKTRAPRSRASQLRLGHHLRRGGIEKGQAGEHQVKHEQVMGTNGRSWGGSPPMEDNGDGSDAHGSTPPESPGGFIPFINGIIVTPKELAGKYRITNLSSTGKGDRETDLL